MTGSSEVIPRERLSAWQRWELASLAETPPVPHAVDAARDAQAAALAAAVEEGRERGYHEGRSLADAETARLQQLLAALAAAAAREDQTLADEVLDLALLLARRIAGEALAVRRELLLPVVDAALRQLPHATKRVQIALNPADVDLVRGHVGEAAALHCEVVPRADVESGGCILECDTCEIDATIGGRYARLAAAMGRSDDWLAHS